MSRNGHRSSKVELVDEETIEVKREASVDERLADEFSSTRVSTIKDEASSSTSSSPSHVPANIGPSRSSIVSTPRSKGAMTEVPAMKKPPEESNGHASPPKELPPPSKLSRSAAQKGVPRIAPLFDYLPDSTAEAETTFSVMNACTYQNKYLGYTEHAMECDCSEEWDSVAKQNFACGDDSDCINRATKMECVGDCACGPACLNQRFGRRLYADVSVIKTEKKGYGLRTNVDLKHGDFIFEYIGEVIAEAAFRRRMLQYDDEGIKHFYFMSLSKGEFVDATKRGNMGRFCNHSCNPNCFVDKWVVGDKLRMGIFAERAVKAGEELVFNYNVDRYGANPQPCYCGESNCTGFIGGKTQTERATKLSSAMIEALGIDDADSWDTVVAKKPRKKKTGEDDEEYVESVEAKNLDAGGVTKVMAALMQCKEKWIAVKLLQRIQRCEDEQVRHRIVKLHGYQILNSQLSAWREDENVVLQILDILEHFPRLTRNKIVDAKIDKTLEPLRDHGDERVASKSRILLDAWSQLELAYRIPRKRREDTTGTPVKQELPTFERRASAQQRKRSRSRSRSDSPARGASTVSAPSGPRSSQGPGFRPRPPAPAFHRGSSVLPRGWFTATDNTGKTYFYSANGQTTWARPTQPADQPPPPPKQPSQQDVLKSIIDNIVTAKEKERETKNTAADTPEPSKKEKREEKWKSYDEDKKKKLYENTLFPHISHVMNKYKQKIPRDDLKRFAKEIAKKLVASDFAKGRVRDPTKIDERQQKKVKEFCKQYFEKAAHKHKKHEQERAARKVKKAGIASSAELSPAAAMNASPDADADVKKEEDSDMEDIKMSEDESDNELDTPGSPPGQNGTSLKRKRSTDGTAEMKEEQDDLTGSPLKKLHSLGTPPPPPPPPAPPAESPPADQAAGSVTPTEADETSLHADTNFKSKSMADVLKEAQQEENGQDTEMEMDVEEADEAEMKQHKETDTRFEQGLRIKGDLDPEDGLENPLVDGQARVEEVVMKRENGIDS